MAAGPDDLRDAIQRRPLTDPSIRVFRPRIWPLTLVLAVLFIGMLAAFFVLIFTFHPYVIAAFVLLASAVVVWMRLVMPTLSLAGKGLNTWAISPTHLLYVSPRGTSMPIALAAITSVALDEHGVPVIAFEGTMGSGQRATLTMELPGLAARGIRGFFERPGPPSDFVAEVEKARRALPTGGAPSAAAEPAADLAPAGAELIELTEPIQEPNLERHLAQAKVVERCRFGRYEVAFLDVRGLPGAVIRYSFRAMVLAPGRATPVLSVNHEGSLMGTSCWGAHQGSEHLNLGDAPVEVDYEAFKERAVEEIRQMLARA